MSASNVILHPEAGYLFSDGGAWNPDGTLGRIESKLHLFPDVPAAVVIRGFQPPPFAVRFMLGEHETLDSLLDRLFVVAKRLAKQEIGTEFPAESYGFDFRIVAWDAEKGEPMGLLLDGKNPDQIMRLPPLYLTPDFEDVADLGKPLVNEADVLELDPLADGLRLMKMQRQKKRDFLSNGELIHSVGGFAEVAVVTATGVERKLLHEWPDEVGKPISVDSAPAHG